MAEESNKTSRRTVIRSLSGSAATIGVAGLAGCIGDEEPEAEPDPDPTDDDDDDTEPAEETDFPEREIEMIVPFGPGGGTDTYARLVAQHLPKHLPNEVDIVVRNVEGGGGILGTNQVYNAEPDGYTIQQGHLESQTMSEIMPDIDADYHIPDFTMLGSSADATRGWHGNADAVEEYDNWDLLADGIDSHEIQISSASRGGTGHVGPMMFGELSDRWDPLDMNIVHYEGFGDSVPPLLRGDHQVGFCTFSSALVYARDEDDFAISNVLAEEHEEFTTSYEFGIPEDVVDEAMSMFTNVRAIWAPPEVPDDRTEILREAIWDTLHDDELLAEAEEAERPIHPREGEEVQEIAQDFYDNWSERIDLLVEAEG